MDIVSPEKRSQMMAGIRGKDTKPEIIVRKALHSTGLRFRLHRKDVAGVPDIVLPGRRVAIFVHGCFWHMHEGCKYFKLPSSNEEFWREKLSKNVCRDRLAISQLQDASWRVLTIWECTTRNRSSLEALANRMHNWVCGNDRVGQMP